MSVAQESNGSLIWSEKPFRLFVRRLALMIFGGLANTSLLCGPVIASQLASQLDYSPRIVGLFFSAEFAGYLLGGLTGRWLLPRFGWRRLAYIYLAGFCAGSLLSVGALGMFPVLLAIRLATATCSASLGMVCMATANEDKNPNQALSLYIMGQLIVGAIGLVALPPLLAHWGIASFFIAIALSVVIVVGLTQFLADGKVVKSTGQRSGQASVSGELWLRFPAVLFFYLGLGGIWTFAGAIGTALPLDSVRLGWMLSMATVAGIAGAALAAVINQATDVRRTIAIGYAILLAGTAAFAWPSSPAIFFAGALAFKFAWTFVIPFVLSTIGRLDRDGSMIADINLVVGLGLALGPGFGGLLIEEVGGFNALLLVEGLLLCLAWISAHRLAKPSAPVCA